jgi:hypothetical protein
MTDRKQVTEHRDVMGRYDTHKISDFIKNLQELQTEGWETIEMDKENYPYDNEDYYYVRVYKTRLETDIEYNARIGNKNEMKENRRRDYERLRKEFE